MFVNCVTDSELPSKCVTYVAIGEVAHKPGIFQPYKGEYLAELEVSSLGGFIVLSVMQKGAICLEEIKDVTGISWVTESLLIYSVSPIYGNPGVYIFNCITKETKRIVATKNINATYPKGADYFELYRLDRDKIYFYYTSDVDSVNFNEFRSQPFLFQVNFDGSEVKKTMEDIQ